MVWAVAISLGILGLSYLLAVLSINLDEEHKLLKFLMFGFVLYLGVPAITTAAEVAKGYNAAVELQILGFYQVYLWLLYAVIAYFAIYFIWAVAMALLRRKNLDQEDEYEGSLAY
jgi:hypothetical protein